LKKISRDSKSMDINEIGLLPEFRNFWNQVEAKGRSWGKKRDGKNPYYGSHFAFIDKGEIVLFVGRKKKGVLPKIFQFRKTKNTCLGRKLKKILSAYNIES
jgi:hypothetical protein